MGDVVMTELGNSFSFTVIPYMYHCTLYCRIELCCVKNISILHKVLNQPGYTEGLKYADNHVHFNSMVEKWNMKFFISDQNLKVNYFSLHDQIWACRSQNFVHAGISWKFKSQQNYYTIFIQQLNSFILETWYLFWSADCSQALTDTKIDLVRVRHQHCN